MFADTFMIQQKEIQIQASSQELHSKTFQKIGFAHFAE